MCAFIICILIFCAKNKIEKIADKVWFELIVRLLEKAMKLNFTNANMLELVLAFTASSYDSYKKLDKKLSCHGLAFNMSSLVSFCLKKAPK